MWTDEQRKAARERLASKGKTKKTDDIRVAMRVPVGGRRNITTVNDTPDGFVDRWVNDVNGRVSLFARAGYEHVPAANIGDSGVDEAAAQAGVVSREMGQAVTAYLMRQNKDDFKADQAAKQLDVDTTEDSIRRETKDKLKDGHYGEVTIGRH